MNYYALFAGAIGLLVLGMRTFEWLNQRKILKNAAANGNPLKREKVRTDRVWIYIGLLLIAIVMIYFMDELLVTKISLAVVFTMLLASEIIGMYTSYALYTNEREFMYGTEMMRFKGIRTFKPKNKKNVEIHGMNGTIIVVPTKIANVIKMKKEGKKKQAE
ncbi:MAG: hypothetical protein E4G74_03725 [Erysipelotrichales bacterium]|nr:MAG: hypothetical protein E4G74_03725 [Erysipelotrichales bacterium]